MMSDEDLSTEIFIRTDLTSDEWREALDVLKEHFSEKDPDFDKRIVYEIYHRDPDAEWIYGREKR